MPSLEKLISILDRSRKGKVCSTHEWDREILPKTIKEKLKKYKIEKDETDHRYCLMTMNSEQVTLWLKRSEFWDNMYAMIRILQIETDKPRKWEE